VVDICRNQTAGYGLILKIGRSVQKRDLTPSSEQVKAAVEDNGAVLFLSSRGGAPVEATLINSRLCGGRRKYLSFLFELLEAGLPGMPRWLCRVACQHFKLDRPDACLLFDDGS
jgi:hypothetical protein